MTHFDEIGQNPFDDVDRFGEANIRADASPTRIEKRAATIAKRSR